MIDTILFKYENIAEEGKLKLEKVVQKNSNIKEGKICVKPNKNKTSTLREILEVKKEVDEQMGEVGGVQRVDIAFDTLEKLEGKTQLYRLFLYCFGLSTGKKVKLYNTNELFRKCNLKISLSNYDLSVYNCEDKERKANTRTEYRSLFIRSSETDKNIIINEIEKYDNQLREVIKNIDLLIKQVEEELLKDLKKEYKRQEFKYINFSAFIDHIDRLGLVLTKNVLAELMKENKMTSKATDFIRSYRKRRNGGLRFTSKKELKELCDKITEENYKILTE